MTAARAAAIVGFLVAFGCHALPAQQSHAPRAGVAEGRSGDVPVSADTPAVRGGPHSVVVLIVPVPAVLPRDSAVGYEVIPAGAMQFLGPLTGVLPASTSDRIVAVALRVPSQAPPGHSVAGRVRFSVGGHPRVDVVCAIDVPRVRRGSIVLQRRLFAARIGERVTLDYHVTNSGNALDTIDLHLVLPESWGGGIRPAARHVLVRSGVVVGSATVAIPHTAATGSGWLQLVARDAAGELSQATAMIEVLDGDTRQPGSARLTTSLAMVVADTTPVTPALGLELEGPVASGVRVYGRLVQAADAGDLSLRGLSRVGLYPGNSLLALSAARWRLVAGNASQTFTDITGVNLWGRGVAFAYDGGRWTTASILARPLDFSSTGHTAGHLVGAQLGRHWGEGMLRATLTSADDPQTSRHLDALGVGGTTAPLGRGFELSGELAARRFTDGSGPGWIVEAKQRYLGRSVFVRYTHAAGGSAAFAPARDLLSALFTEQVTSRLRVNGAAWVSSDGSATFSRLRSSGWSGGPQVAVTRATTVEFAVRGSGFVADGASDTLGSSEVLAQLGAVSRVNHFVVTGSVAAGQSTRSLAASGGAASDAAAGRFLARGTLGRSTPIGIFEVAASYERNGVGVGLLPWQYLVALRAVAVPVPVGRFGATVSADVQRYGWSGTPPSATILHAALNLPLPGELAFTIDVERNPLLHTRNGQPSWNTAMRLAQSLSLPFARLRGTARGRVYMDGNDNGVRDADEHGLAGILVRRGGETAITDADGRFRFLASADGPARIDESSLPFGLVANNAALPAGAHTLDIGVIPTAPVSLRLVPAADSGQTVPPVSFARVRVYARDDAGNAWTARPDSNGVAVFHALPPGHYRVELDLTELSPPVVLRGSLPDFVVAPGQDIPTIVIPLFGRPVRMFDPNNPGRSRNQSGQP